MKNRLLAVPLLIVLTGLIAVAQNNHGSTSSSSKGQTNEDTMQACRKHGSESMAALDKLEKTIAAGRESNDPTKMRAALDQAQKELAEARHHMSMCPMMSGGMMEHGGMDHMQHHGTAAQKSAPDTTKNPK